MSDLTPEEITAQGSAMANYLHGTVIDLTAKLAEAKGQLAIAELRLQAALAKVPKDE